MPSNAGQNMMSPPTPGMNMQPRMQQYHQQMRHPAPGTNVYDPSMSQPGQMPMSNFQQTGGGVVSNQQAQQHYANYGTSMHPQFRPPMGFNGQPQPPRGNAPANPAMRGGMMVNGTMNPASATGPRPMRPPSSKLWHTCLSFRVKDFNENVFRHADARKPSAAANAETNDDQPARSCGQSAYATGAV